jgi:hypothetical protein
MFIFFVKGVHDEILVMASIVDVVFKNLNKRQLQKGVGVGQPL